ncbi:hypothetical protein LWI28_004776 [Acer negundo]|uniref:SAP domain-containing protein n=1 Tax=Acer negundo TaxID=4023 RepID=A0AAD5NL93_ACENE|nr:hypothetical protein LWI28_004776 [Acer negundo]KAK4840534.1 hypothetical protein QYF36_011199 [Acer negundo]
MSEREKSKHTLICLSDSEEEEDDDDDDYEEDEGSVSDFSEDDESDEMENRDDNGNGNDVESLCNRVICLLQDRGDLGALNVKECKAYLRKHGLRVSGSKTVCIQRIEEHWSEADESDEKENQDDNNNGNDVESLCNRVIFLLQERGDLGALNVQECKAYLRKHGLRVSGSKAVCIQRIEEHWRIRDGNGEALYPKSSFVVNCTGDVCRDDVVLFTQKVYEKFDKVTRHGRVLGRRTVAGRVVHESYGAAKQQHTFTIEVIWSKGFNKLPPLFPLLVKGRNLYRLRTFRQHWNNEAERVKVLAEKHKRGAAARTVRAMRLTKKTWPANEGAKRQKHSHHTGSSASNRGKSIDVVRKAMPPRPAKFNSHCHEAPSPRNPHLKQNARSVGSQFSQRGEKFHHLNSSNGRPGPALQSNRPLQTFHHSQMEFHYNNAPFHFHGHDSTSTMMRSTHFNTYTGTSEMPPASWYHQGWFEQRNYIHRHYSNPEYGFEIRNSNHFAEYMSADMASRKFSFGTEAMDRGRTVFNPFPCRI